MLCSFDVFAAKKLKNNNLLVVPVPVVDVAEFIRNCTSMVEIDEKLAYKCSINFSNNAGKEIFSQIEPNTSPQGKFEKRTEYDQRITESLAKWNGLHVIFQANHFDVLYRVLKYNQDSETLLIHIMSCCLKNATQINFFGERKNISTYEASNVFGRSLLVEKSDLLEYAIIDDDGHDSDKLLNIEIPMSIDDAKKDLENVAIGYEVKLVLRYNEENVLSYKSVRYQKLEPTISAPRDTTAFFTSYFVKINKVIVFNEKTGKVLAVARR